MLGLVDYSSSSDEEEGEQQKVKDSGTKSKLPNPFQKSEPDEESPENPSADHNGKIRTFAHERGIWATYIYIHCPLTQSIQTLQNELINIITMNPTFESIDIHPIEELHLSLTRTTILRHHWIDEFVRSVQNNFKNVSRFWIPLNSIRIYCNDNRTRTFISLALNKNESSVQNHLIDIVKRLDYCLSEFNLPPFYEEASFHVSLLWCLGDKKTTLETLLLAFSETLERLSTNEPSEFILNVEQLHAKIGNKLFNFPI